MQGEATLGAQASPPAPVAASHQRGPLAVPRQAGRLRSQGLRQTRAVFLSKGVKDKGRGRIVGNNHLKLSLSQSADVNSFESIAFQLGEHHPQIEKGGCFDVCYTVEENSFNGNITLQLNIKDLKFHNADVLVS